MAMDRHSEVALRRLTSLLRRKILSPSWNPLAISTRDANRMPSVQLSGPLTAFSGVNEVLLAVANRDNIVYKNVPFARVQKQHFSNNKPPRGDNRSS